MPTGDLNNDGIVDAIDLSIFVYRWGSSDPDADLNNDGIVDAADLSILVSNWGASSGLPIAAFSWYPDEPTVNQEVVFDASSSENAVSWSWDDVGPDGIGSWPLGPPGQTMTFTFLNEGVKYVRLIVENASGDKDELVQPVAVSAAVPVPDAPLLSGSSSDQILSWWWNAPSEATGFEVEIDASDPIDIGNNTTYSIDGLSIGESRTLRVRAYGLSGAGPWSQPLQLILTASTEPGDTIPTTMQSLVTKGGITWTLDKAYPVGQYVNGDQFVVAPSGCVVSAISPPWGEVFSSELGRAIRRNGSMLDPSYGETGYWQDTGRNHFGYSDMHNVARNLPLTIIPSSGSRSLISTIGLTGDEPGVTTAGSGSNKYLRPHLDRAEILTIVSEVPLSGSFRPGYAAGLKREYNLSQLREEYLLSLSTPSSIPDVSSRLTAPILSHRDPIWGREVHPRQNHPDYGRDLAVFYNETVLALLTDSMTLNQKRPILYRAVQAGIDLFSVYESANGSALWAQSGGLGGHGSGRRWPIIFAGHMLDASEMAGLEWPVGSEDAQLHIFPSNINWDGRPGWANWSSGQAAWHERAAFTPSSQSNWSYLTCCNGNAWIGAALAARLIGAQPRWGNQLFFEFCDWYAATAKAQFGPDAWQWGFTSFLRDMWDEHR